MQLFFWGHTVLDDLRVQLKNLQIKHLFLVRGSNSFAKCGAESALYTIFSELGIIVTEYKNFSVNPKIEDVLTGVQLFCSSNADCILAVGGGSVLDVAKMIRHYAVELGQNTLLIAMPTTAGTGAEATHFAVVYVNGKKQSIEADDILPDMVYIYPPFTYGNDSYLTACTGFDALAQAFEAYWNRFANEESTQYAMKAISLLLNNLPKCVNHPTEQIRDEVALGAYWAGKAINITRTTAPHAFSYAFTNKFGYPHGHAVALTFPFFAELNLHQKGLCQYFKDYVCNLGLTYRGEDKNNLNAILHEANIQRLLNNPVDIGEKEIKNLLEYFDE